MMAKQRGRNIKYPEKINYWIYGKLPVPEWLSDITRIKGVNAETGEAILDMKKTNTGGYELTESGGNRTIIKTKSMEDYVCFGNGTLFSLTPNQFNLLYE